MEVLNCPRCGKLFTKIRNSFCPACERAEEEVFNTLKEYMDENPHCTMAQLSEATHVSTKRITQYIREGRLEITKGMSNDIRCEKCGKPITRGRFCDSCAVAINHSVVEMFSANKESSNSRRMFTSTGKKKL